MRGVNINLARSRYQDNIKYEEKDLWGVVSGLGRLRIPALGHINSVLCNTLFLWVIYGVWMACVINFCTDLPVRGVRCFHPFYVNEISVKLHHCYLALASWFFQRVLYCFKTFLNEIDVCFFMRTSKTLTKTNRSHMMLLFLL